MNSGARSSWSDVERAFLSSSASTVEEELPSATPTPGPFSGEPEEEVIRVDDVAAECDPMLGQHTSAVDENHLNWRRFEQIRRQCSAELIRLVEEEHFEYGLDTRADALVREQMQRNEVVTKQWLNHLFLKHFAEVPVIVGLLRIVARFHYATIYPQGQLMAVAALAHDNTEVKECGVRAFESWETLESLHILETLSVSTDWLQEYIGEVVQDLREEHNVSICQKSSEEQMAAK